jgi:hypothetical protein
MTVYLSRHLRIFLLSVVVVPAFALMTGCAVPSSGPTPTPVPGVLTGHVYSTGGPHHRSDPYPAKLTATALHAPAPAIHDFEAGADGAFRVELPPGDYTITGTLISGGNAGKTTPQEVTILSGETTTVDITSVHP